MEGKPEKEFSDVVFVQGPTEDGEGARGLRARMERLELAEIRPVKEGQHIGDSELVSLHPTKFPFLYDVEVLYSAGEKKERADHAGPPRVASGAYRRGWDLLFGNSAPSGEDPPN